MNFPVSKIFGLAAILSVTLACNSNNSVNQSSDAETLTLSNTEEPTDKEPGMVWIPGGEFTMGTNEEDAYDAEKPAVQLKVVGVWMDTHEVTNAEYTAFTETTGYVTVAERKPDWEELKLQVPPGTPKTHDSLLVS